MLTLFDPTEARHFCGAFANSRGQSEGEAEVFLRQFGIGRQISEGTSVFDEVRDCLLRDAERLLFLGLSNYRRAFDLLLPSACGWAQVTLYYSGYFAASALLAMFGARTYWRRPYPLAIQVDTGRPGSQVLKVVNTRPMSTYRGSHQRFWDLFYASVSTLVPSIDPPLRIAVTPVSNNPTWLIEERNAVNYESRIWYQAMEDFQVSFRRSNLRSSLPGALSTQFEITEGLLRVSCGFGRTLGLTSDALMNVLPEAARSVRIRSLIYDASSATLGNQARRRGLIL